MCSEPKSADFYYEDGNFLIVVYYSRAVAHQTVGRTILSVVWLTFKQTDRIVRPTGNSRCSIVYL